MGNKNSGPRPAPTAFKILKGTRKDRINVNEPKIDPAPPEFDEPPIELDGDQVAIDEWQRVIPMLRRAGVISVVEKSALIAMVQQWSRYIDAQKEIMENGSVIDGGEKTGPIVSPHVAVGDKALTHCLKLWVEMGLTPSGRSKLTALASAKDAPKSKWAGVL